MTCFSVREVCRFLSPHLPMKDTRSRKEDMEVMTNITKVVCDVCAVQYVFQRHSCGIIVKVALKD